MTIKSAANRIVHNAAAKSAEIFIYDEIGPSEWGLVGAKDFVSALKSLGDVQQIDVRINSPGGSVWEASAIYNALKNHKATITVHIDGIAFSAASFIAMAGDEINMAENAMLMIHRCSTVAWGNAEDLAKEAAMLGQFDATVIGIYAARTGLDSKEVSDLMAAETWFTAAEAKAKGFATAISPNKAVSAKCDLANFKNVPDWAKQALVNFMKEPDMSVQTEAEKKAAADKLATDTKAAADAKAVADKAAADKAAADKKALDDKAAADAAAIKAAAGDQTPVTMTKAELQQMMDRTVAAARYRDAEIDAICARAGVPHMAAGFKADPKIQLADVKDRMIDVLCAKNVPAGDPSGANTNGQGSSPDAKYKAEFAQHKDIYLNGGFTEETYIASRKKEDGIK